MFFALRSTIAVLVLLFGSQIAIADDVFERIKKHQFDFAQPANLGAPLQLWATFYRAHKIQNRADGLPLLNPAGQELGPKLERRQWCDAAIQGTATVVDGTTLGGTYNYVSRAATPQTDCTIYLAEAVRNQPWAIAIGRSRFMKTEATYGLGVHPYILVPFRSIAVDRRIIPYGTILYIPAARGVSITLFDGRTITHDGYFYAVDKGGAITGTHIDVFVGLNDSNPFRFVTSRPTPTFPAHVITDPAITAKLKELHRLP